jgi:GT2 family glycosyltransferase
MLKRQRLRFCPQPFSVPVRAIRMNHPRLLQLEDRSPSVSLMTTDHSSPSMQAQRPLISIIMPVYNGEKFIQEAIESVFAQTVHDFELIVVDDGSTDATLAILETYADRLTILRQQNSGHAAARNAAVRISRGQWIAMIDADDLWHADKLAQQLAVAGDAQVIYTAAFNFEDSSRVDTTTFADGNCHNGDVFDHLLLDNFITHSSILMKRDAFLQAGGYDESLKTTCDWDLWLRMSAAGCRFQGTPAPLTHYRWRATSNSRNHDCTCRDRLNVVKNALRSPRGRRTSLLVRQKAIARVWQTSAWFVAEKDDRKALNWYLRSVVHRPYSIRGWKEVTRCCLHLCGISRRRIKRMLKRKG